MFSFAHISDLHLPLPSVKPWQLMSKRILGYLSWQRKRRFLHQLSILDALKKDMLAHAPDHIAVTGDVTNIGLPQEFKQAVQWLGNLSEEAQVSLIPGNHDAYVRSAAKAIPTYFSPWMKNDDGGNEMPFLRCRESVAFIGVSSAVATPPFFASGRVARRQLKRLKPLLAKVREEGRLPVLMIHHPPVKGLSSFRKSLRHIDAIVSAVGREKPLLILHGHLHRPLQHKLGDNVLVFGAGSASCNGAKSTHPAHYYLFDVEKQAAGFSVTVRGREYDAKNDSFREVRKDSFQLG